MIASTSPVLKFMSHKKAGQQRFAIREMKCSKLDENEDEDKYTLLSRNNRDGREIDYDDL